MKVVHLDSIEGARIGDASWKPIRSTLGIRAFGINAYVADRAGAQLFDEHDETEAGAGDQRHEELYFVLAGRAVFTIDGADLDAPAGTLVFVDDPASRRSAVSADPRTTILAIGGPVGEGYEIAPWEYWFRLRAATEKGDASQARAVAREGITRYPDDERLSQALEHPPE
jgi:hypothetical protein